VTTTGVVVVVVVVVVLLELEVSCKYLNLLEVVVVLLAAADSTGEVEFAGTTFQKVVSVFFSHDILLEALYPCLVAPDPAETTTFPVLLFVLK
jgi:hypothetical protein